MGLQITQGKDVGRSIKERILLYGAAGIGKTRAALSLTPRFGRIAYYAADDGSEFLASIAPEKRDRVVVVKPSGDSPEKNFMQFCMQDWSKVDPTVETLVVDTFSTLAHEVLQWSANNNVIDRESTTLSATSRAVVRPSLTVATIRPSSPCPGGSSRTSSGYRRTNILSLSATRK
jgi:hypothetical protein